MRIASALKYGFIYLFILSFSATVSAQSADVIWEKPQIESLIEAVILSAAHGLSPEDYGLRELQSSALSQAQRSIVATSAYMTLAKHLLSGKLNPASMEPTWNEPIRNRDMAQMLALALEQGEIKDSLYTLAPQQAGYKILLGALAEYRQIAEKGGWPKIDAGATLKPSMSHPRVFQLRERLRKTGDLESRTSANSELFDSTLEEAVKRFQKRANLEPDGTVGGATLKQLNVSVNKRIHQIQANLERWRWLPEDLGKKHLRVNIADFRLELFENGKVMRVKDVIVGKPFRKTPVFSGKMSYLIFNPWWETPSSLARLDKLPIFKKDPAAFNRLGFQALDRNGKVVPGNTINWRQYSSNNFPFRLRQKPGAKNALGQVKFMLPNQYNVYLHDTPTRELFDKTRRDFSSGCIRVKEPLDLAEWVLSAQSGWSRNHINEVVDSGTETKVPIPDPIAVHILYNTVIADIASKTIRFVEDIYNRDSKIIAALSKERS